KQSRNSPKPKKTQSAPKTTRLKPAKRKVAS
ncbi:his Kinase A domain protein, partial [Vibrio parahaemolyticus V-223/04]